MNQKACKHDQGKPELSLVPRASLEAIARAMTFGKNKYGRDNWRLGFEDNMRVMDACLRHLAAFNDGEICDPESGLCHLDHAIANLAFLTHYYKQGELNNAE